MSQSPGVHDQGEASQAPFPCSVPGCPKGPHRDVSQMARPLPVAVARAATAKPLWGMSLQPSQARGSRHDQCVDGQCPEDGNKERCSKHQLDSRRGRASSASMTPVDSSCAGGTRLAWPLTSGNGHDSAKLQVAGPRMARILVGTEWAPDQWPAAAVSRYTNEGWADRSPRSTLRSNAPRERVARAWTAERATNRLLRSTRRLSSGRHGPAKDEYTPSTPRTWHTQQRRPEIAMSLHWLAQLGFFNGEIHDAERLNCAAALAGSVSLFHLDQLASSRATTARTTAVIRVVLQRSFRRSRQHLRIAMARSPRLRILAWSRL